MSVLTYFLPAASKYSCHIDWEFRFLEELLDLFLACRFLEGLGSGCCRGPGTSLSPFWGFRVQAYALGTAPPH